MPLVVLTGATSGIGRAAAIELVRRGADVAIVGRDPAKVAATAQAAGGTTYAYVADLERMDEVRRLAGELLPDHDRLDGLANNARATSRPPELRAERPRESGARVFTTASDAHPGGALDWEDLQSARSFKPMGT